MFVKILKRSIFGLLALSVVANYSWVHAAIVFAAAEGNCAPGLVSQAQARVAHLYGGVQSTPWLSCLDEPHLGLGETIGTTHFAPGLPAVIILNADGQNVDVLAHEWAHAEYASRIGVLQRTYAIPTWFDEGLAMQVDWRPSYGDAALAELIAEQGGPPELADISSPETFFQPGAQGRLHYAYSRCVVTQVLKTSPLTNLLEEMLPPGPEQERACGSGEIHSR